MYRYMYRGQKAKNYKMAFIYAMSIKTIKTINHFKHLIGISNNLN